MPTHQTLQRVTKAYAFYARARGEDMQWMGCRRQEDQLDCKSDYYRVYIHIE